MLRNIVSLFIIIIFIIPTKSSNVTNITEVNCSNGPNPNGNNIVLPLIASAISMIGLSLYINVSKQYILSNPSKSKESIGKITKKWTTRSTSDDDAKIWYHINITFEAKQPNGQRLIIYAYDFLLDSETLFEKINHAENIFQKKC